MYVANCYSTGPYYLKVCGIYFGTKTEQTVEFSLKIYARFSYTTNGTAKEV